MKGRVPLNTQNLKKIFPEVYKDIFTRCSIVTSSPGSFWWTGEHFVLYGSFGINQKIPLRAYIGLEPNNTDKVKFSQLKKFNPSLKKFEDYTQDEPVGQKLTTWIKEHLRGKSGVNIYVLSEIPPSRGLNSSGAFSSAIALALKLFNDSKKEIPVDLWNKEDLSNLLQKDSDFSQIIKEAWKIECIFHGDIASGGTVVGSAVPSIYPIAYFPPNLSTYLNAKNTHWKTKYSFIDNLTLEAKRLNEIFDLPPYPIWPIDYALIYSGDERGTAAAVMSATSRKEELLKTEAEVKKIAKTRNNHIANSLLPKTSGTFFDLYVNEIKTISCEILLSLRDIFTQGSSEETLSRLFTFMRRNHELLRFMIPTSEEINIICKEVSKYKCGFKITGGGGKGDILTCFPYHGLRDEMGKFVTKAKRLTKMPIALDYASWLDGFEEEGLKVEQSLEDKIFSDFVSEGSVQIKSVSKNGKVSTLMLTKEEFEKQKGSMDLMLDLENEIIYVKGNEISSKEIPSSKTTTKVLSKLAQKLGKEITNSALGQSSYFEERNEFQSKIVSPLNKTLQKRLKRSLSIVVSGKLDEFTVKLHPSSFDVYLLEKTF